MPNWMMFLRPLRAVRELQAENKQLVDLFHKSIDREQALINRCFAVHEDFQQVRSANISYRDAFERASWQLKQTQIYALNLKGECDSLRKNDQRYRWLRARDLETVYQGGVFAGLTPDNMVLNGEDLDDAVDAAIRKEAENA